MKRLSGDQLLDPDFIKAISHPVRIEILWQATVAPISPTEFREQLGAELSPQRIAHHFKALEECNAIKKVGSRPGRRNVAETLYGPTNRTFFSQADYENLPPPLRSSLSSQVFRSFMQRAEESLLANKVDAHTERHLSWRPMELDWPEFLELAEKLNEVYQWTEELQSRADRHLAETGREPMYVTSAMFSFESPAPVRRTDKSKKST